MNIVLDGSRQNQDSSFQLNVIENLRWSFHGPTTSRGHFHEFKAPKRREVKLGRLEKIKYLRRIRSSGFFVFGP